MKISSMIRVNEEKHATSILGKPGANPGFLKMEFICIKVWGFVLLILSHFS